MSGTAIKLLFLTFIFVYIYACLCLELDDDMQKILSELSWSTKAKFLEFVTKKKDKPRTIWLTEYYSYNCVPKLDLRSNHLILISSFVFSLLLGHARRRVRSVDTRREWNISMPVSAAGDEELMKIKLFRLMYETVKDSDLKIRRAELVKAGYENATGFDLGYVVGDVTDKLNVMQDIANTLKRLYDVWRPVEHVNAYEQVANLAIEVTHLVDMVRVMTATQAASVIAAITPEIEQRAK